jgi:hypothetical protein
MKGNISEYYHFETSMACWLTHPLPWKGSVVAMEFGLNLSFVTYYA